MFDFNGGLTLSFSFSFSAVHVHPPTSHRPYQLVDHLALVPPHHPLFYPIWDLVIVKIYLAHFITINPTQTDTRYLLTQR